MRVLRSLAFYLVFYGATLVLLFVAMGQLASGGRGFVALTHFWCRFHRACVERILGIRVVVEGAAPPAPVLVAMKHESFFEALDMTNLLPHPGIFAKVELMRLPLWGHAARVYGLVTVERDKGATALRRMIAAARQLTAQGRPLAIFPEGTRVPHGEAPPLQSGFAGLYKMLGVPVVPVAVDSGPCYHRLWKKRGTITVRFGEPIPPGLPREEVEARVREAINVLNTPE